MGPLPEGRAGSQLAAPARRHHRDHHEPARVRRTLAEGVPASVAGARPGGDEGLLRAGNVQALREGLGGRRGPLDARCMLLRLSVNAMFALGRLLLTNLRLCRDLISA